MHAQRMVQLPEVHPRTVRPTERSPQKRYLAHDEENNCNIGDEVIFEENRPLSKRKRWVVKKILNKSVIVN